MGTWGFEPGVGQKSGQARGGLLGRTAIELLHQFVKLGLHGLTQVGYAQLTAAAGGDDGDAEGSNKV